MALRLMSAKQDKTFDTAVDRFMLRCEARNLSPRTTEYYQHRLQSFSRFLDREGLPRVLDQISTEVLRQFLDQEIERHSPTTAYHGRIALCALMKFCCRDGLITTNPADGLEQVRRRKSIIPTFSPTQIEGMLATCDTYSLPDMRDKAMLCLLFDCGLRVSELCGLTDEAIDWHEGTLRVLGKGDKERLVPFGRAAGQVLREYLAKRGPLEDTKAVFVSVFGAPLSRHRVREIIRKRGTEAGITGVRLSPHTLRHSYAVAYLRNGGDCFTLQKALGHTDLTMTRRYAELSSTDVIDAHRQCSPGDRLNVLPQSRKRKKLW